MLYCLHAEIIVEYQNEIAHGLEILLHPPVLPTSASNL